MSSPVVTKEFWWKFRDGVTQEVAKARQAIQQGADEVREEGSKVANTGEDWKKMGTDAKEAAQETSQSLDSMKEKLLSYQHAATDASKNIREQFNESKQVLNGIPKQKTVSIKAQIDSNKLKSFSRKIHDVPEQKSTWLKIKDGFSNQMNKAQRQSKNTQKAFSELKGVMAGTFVGGAILNGISAIGNGLKEATAAGMQFDTEQQKMQQTWLTLTNSKNAAKGMVDTINDLSVKTGQSRDLVNELEQGFYHLHSSKEESDAMTKSMLNMGDAVGLTSDQMKQVEQDMVHGLATGKVTQGELNQIGMYFPMIDEAMAKHFHTSVRGMREMAHAGKISGKDLEEVFEQLGSGKYEKAADNMMQSMWGMERTIKTQTPALIGAFEKPFFNMKNPFYAAVSKWMLDPATQKSFENAGKTMSKAIGDGLSGFSNFMKNMSGINRILGALIKNLGSGAWTGFKLTLEVIAEAFSLIGKAVNAILNPLGKATKGIKGIGILATPIKAVGVAMGVVGAMATTYAVGLAAYKTAMLAAAGASKVFEAAMKALDVVMDLNPIGIAIVVIGALIAAFVLAYKKIKPFRDIVNKTGEAIKKLFTGKYDWEQSFGKGLANLGKSFQNFAKKIPQFFKAVGKAIIKTIVIGLALPVGIGITLMKPLIKPLQNSTKSLIKTVQKQWQSFSKWLGKLFDPVAKLWNRVWNDWARIFSTVWKSLKKTASSGMKAIERLISPAVKAIEKVWVTSWNAIASFFSGIWHTITSLGGNGMRMLHSAIAGPLNTISSIWHSVWNSISSFFRGIWNGIKQAAQDGMNGVINVINAGIGGINKVWSFFTGHGTGLNKLGHVHFAQGGTVHRHLSVINDGDGPDWKELVQTPDGNLFMSQERNWTGFLPEGTRVYSGAETRQIMNAVGVSHYATGGIVGAQHFADGGIIGEGIDWAKGSLENIGSWLGDKFSALEDFLADPLKATKGLLEKATSGLYKGLGNFADVAHGAMDKLTQPIADWFKKGLEKLEAQFESGGASPDLIRAAAAKMHVAISGADISHIMNVIKHESGGNARAINNWDSNAKAGHPSKGILQFIDGTFRKYAVAGHTNIYSPFDQLLAMFNDTTWRSDLTLGGWGPTGGRRFATGGEVFGLTNAIIGDNPEHHEFVLNPYAVSAEPLLDRAFEATAQAQPANSSTGNGNSKLDQMIDLLGKVLVAIESQDTDIYLDGEKVTDDVSKRQGKTWRLRKN